MHLIDGKSCDADVPLHDQPLSMSTVTTHMEEILGKMLSPLLTKSEPTVGNWLYKSANVLSFLVWCSDVCSAQCCKMA